MTTSNRHIPQLPSTHGNLRRHHWLLAIPFHFSLNTCIMRSLSLQSRRSVADPGNSVCLGSPLSPASESFACDVDKDSAVFSPTRWLTFWQKHTCMVKPGIITMDSAVVLARSSLLEDKILPDLKRPSGIRSRRGYRAFHFKMDISSSKRNVESGSKLIGVLATLGMCWTSAFAGKSLQSRPVFVSR